MALNKSGMVIASEGDMESSEDFQAYRSAM